MANDAGTHVSVHLKQKCTEKEDKVFRSDPDIKSQTSQTSVYTEKKNQICQICSKEYFQIITEKGIVCNKAFSNFVKPFLTSKISSSENDVLIENGETIFEENALLEIFIVHYVNNVEKSWKINPNLTVTFPSATDDEKVINKKVQYRGHISIINPLFHNVEIWSNIL